MVEINENHRRHLAASGISDEVAAARGYRTITIKRDLKALGFSESQLLVPTLVMPVWTAAGELNLYQHRPDQPRMREGKVTKYEFPARAQMAVDVHPFVKDKIRDPAAPLFITEGIKKGDAAVSRGLCCIAMLGVWGFKGRNDWGGSSTSSDWDQMALKYADGRARTVYVVYDSDVMQKRQVYQALCRLLAFLKSRGADPFVIYLPSGPNGEKIGLDDYFVAGYTVDDLMRLATREVLKPVGELEKAESPYLSTPNGLVWRKPSANGSTDVMLTNFDARIVADVAEDDGVERHRFFEIAATVGEYRTQFMVPSGAFAPMGWPIEYLGASALLYPGMGIKEHARAAIQVLSDNPPKKSVHTHTGWKRIGEEWMFLHGGGAIGATEEIEVRLPPTLQAFTLPEPGTDTDAVTALRDSFRLWELSDICIAVHCAIFRVVMGKCDFSLHLVGPTGAFKSEVAALAQQHFGPALDSRHFPGSWTGTENALEAMAFSLKDVLFVVDDFAPIGSQTDVQRLHSKADRLLRGQGNNAGRSRLRADTSFRPAKPPRGMVVSTGEDTPNGLSLRARLLILEVEPGVIDPKRLTECQRKAVDGTYARALYGFIDYLRPMYGDISESLKTEVAAVRDGRSKSGQHRRTPEMFANLTVALNYLLEYAVGIGTFTQEEAEQYRKRAAATFGRIEQAQRAYLGASEPTTRFIELLQAVLVSGRGHFASGEGKTPDNAERWGWRLQPVGSGFVEMRPCGECIGWVQDDNIYLQPASAYAAVKRLGDSSGDGITIGQRTLQKRLAERGMLVLKDATRGTNTVRHILAGERREVLHLHARCLQFEDDMVTETDQSDHPLKIEDGTPYPHDPNGSKSDAIGDPGQIGQLYEAIGQSDEEWRV